VREEFLANTRSAKKRMRQNVKRRQRNRDVRSRARSAVKSARKVVGGGQPESEAAVKQAVRELDQAASKGVIHRNNAARRKSRLMKRLARSKKTP
jgi:small subunit ribosomal protein S20